MGEYLNQPACSIGEHSGSQNFFPRVRKIHAVVDTHQDFIRHDALVISWIPLGHSEMGHLKVTGKRTSPVRSQILPPPIYSKK